MRGSLTPTQSSTWDDVGGVGCVADPPSAAGSRTGIVPPACLVRRAAFPRAAADAVPLDFVAPVAAVPTGGAPPFARAPANAASLDFVAPVEGTPRLVRAASDAAPPDLAPPVGGAPPLRQAPNATGRRSDPTAAATDDVTARPAPGTAESSGGVNPVDLEQDMACAVLLRACDAMGG